MTEPPARMLTLGLLAELAGAGATFCPPAPFAAANREVGAIDTAAHAGARAPFAVTIAVDRSPQDALPFARASAAIGIPLTFLLSVGRDSGSWRPDGEVLRELRALDHHLGVWVPAATRAADVPTLIAEPRAGVEIDVLGVEDESLSPEDALALSKVGGVSVCLGMVTATRGHACPVTFTLRVDRGVLRARSVRGGFTIVQSPLTALDRVGLACLADTVVRGSCLIGLRLSLVA